MTGDEVVALVRQNYGDATVNFWTDAEIEAWVNQALQEVYNFLPAGDMREVVNEDTVSISSGRGDIPPTWDKIVSVYTTDGEAIRMPSHVLVAQNSLSDYFIPDALGYSIDGNEILVTPPSTASVTIQYLVQPDEITTFASEITGIPLRYHYVLGDWATSLAYAAEEDAEQASLFLQRAQGTLSGRLPRGEG